MQTKGCLRKHLKTVIWAVLDWRGYIFYRTKGPGLTALHRAKKFTSRLTASESFGLTIDLEACAFARLDN